MNDHDRYRLHNGPYNPPKFRVGDKISCEYRGREVVVGGMTDAPIQWPFAKSAGQRSPVVCGDLIRAVQMESEIAVAHHWAVNPATVKNWRRALKVPRTTDGTRRLAVAYTPERLTPEVRAMAKMAMGKPLVREKIRATKVGKPLHPNMIIAQREAVRKPRSESWKRKMSSRMKEVWEDPEAHGLPSSHRWTDEEIALLGTEYDSLIARRLGISTHVVEDKRRRLGIPPRRLRWTSEEVALLRTKTDREVAILLGRKVAAVRKKRLLLGINSTVSHWAEAEIALLGTATDRTIAENLGRTKSGVETKRLSLGIPAYRRKEQGNRDDCCH